ncbi:2-amino-4-hydroxy-6-hydroxymethyldihydropteridinepyrophosphokinase [hydrothermal vent metagenome]|uniref:2-amino-4-hydroxy-6-hydroxymethyldihydropteridine diphosphokinase n=1 Tax=hydrothermal vent metagenome TaxID=652676 RepID=A0A3B0S937_9ZZZZ
MPTSRYLIALGSNQRHLRFGNPSNVLKHALAAMTAKGIAVQFKSPVMHSRPLGPSQRTYANSAAIIETKIWPSQLLMVLKKIERDFGKRRGQTWSRRTLDLDIILWSEGVFSSGFPKLTIPHHASANDIFVLAPAGTIAAHWRDPISGLSIAQLAWRLNHPKPLDRKAMDH